MRVGKKERWGGRRGDEGGKEREIGREKRG